MTRVTDLRTGLPHPVRDHTGRFVSRKAVARDIHKLSRNWTPAPEGYYVRDGGAYADVNARIIRAFDAKSR